MSDTKTYPISLSPSYCREWDLQDAIREIIQNQLDSGGGDVNYDKESETLCITNYDNQIPPEYLLLGNGSKTSKDSSRGMHNEGFKIAWLILARLGKEVTVENGDVLWVPYYEKSEMFNTMMLHVDETPLEGNSDVIYTINGITQDDYEEVIDRCAFLRDDVEVLSSSDYGNILKEPTGKLFCGGLFVCDTQEEYGYDISPEYLTLDRDRNKPENYNLKNTIDKMWMESDNKDLAAELLFENRSDAYLFVYSNNKDFHEACYNKAVEEYGEGVALAECDGEKKDLLEQGYEKVVVTGKREFNSVVAKSYSYKNVVQPTEDVVEYTPDEVLQAFFNKHYDNMAQQAHEDCRSILELFEDKGSEWCHGKVLSLPFDKLN